MLMNFPTPGRRHPSKAYLALSASSAPRIVNLACEVSPESGMPVAAVSPEVGSLPINALAIALALAAGISDPTAADWSPQGQV
jgi:hypothetical protein